VAEAEPVAGLPSHPERRGLQEASIDPFALWLAFAKGVRAGQLRTAFVKFLEHWREPIDVRADKRIDLAAFGKGPHLFLKTPRPKRPDELNSDLADRMKNDLERQFNLRNLARFVKMVDKGDPLEFKRRKVEVGKLDIDARAHMPEVYKRIEGVTLESGIVAVRAELAWRHRMLEVMQWERYFSKEIRENYQGPLWRHDPDKADGVKALPAPEGGGAAEDAGGQGAEPAAASEGA